MPTPKWEYKMEENSRLLTEEYLNKLGADGWELASFDVMPNNRLVYLFKRPVAKFVGESEA